MIDPLPVAKSFIYSSLEAIDCVVISAQEGVGTAKVVEKHCVIGIDSDRSLRVIDRLLRLTLRCIRRSEKIGRACIRRIQLQALEHELDRPAIRCFPFLNEAEPAISLSQKARRLIILWAKRLSSLVHLRRFLVTAFRLESAPIPVGSLEELGIELHRSLEFRLRFLEPLA